ncbi:hypothetical protein P7K49_013363, partial [Saguinus oedipus]
MGPPTSRTGEELPLTQEDEAALGRGPGPKGNKNLVQARCPHEPFICPQSEADATKLS